MDKVNKFNGLTHAKKQIFKNGTAIALVYYAKYSAVIGSARKPGYPVKAKNLAGGVVCHFQIPARLARLGQHKNIKLSNFNRKYS